VSRLKVAEEVWPLRLTLARYEVFFVFGSALFETSHTKAPVGGFHRSSKWFQLLQAVLAWAEHVLFVGPYQFTGEKQ